MINLSDIVKDPDFTVLFDIERTTGSFTNEGTWIIGVPTFVRGVVGIIQPTKIEDAAQFLPEGERIKNAINVYCETPLIMSDGKGVQSDIILYRNSKYRVAYSKPWQDFGYYFVIATQYVAPAGS